MSLLHNVQKLGIGQRNCLFYQAKAFALVYEDTHAAAEVLRFGIKRYVTKIWVKTAQLKTETSGGRPLLKLSPFALHRCMACSHAFFVTCTLLN
jgi:hypothetical protein